MNFNKFFLFCIILATPVASIPADRDHPDLPWRDIHSACQPAHLGLSEFNGFRIIHQSGVSFPTIYHTVLTHCVMTKVSSIDSYFPVNKTTEMPWGIRFCSSEHSPAGNCYIMARKKDATFRNIALYYPGDWVGGMFRCPGTLDDNEEDCTNENAFPMYPISADMPAFFWDTLPDLRHYDFRFPMLKAYPVGAELRFGARKYVPYNWFREIDIHENYNYSTDERNLIRKSQDFISNLYARVASVRASSLLTLTWDAEMQDKGDNTPRRNIYKAFPKRHFQPEHWEDEPHYTPQRDYENEIPIVDLLSEFVSSLNQDKNSARMETVNHYGFNETTVKASFEKLLSSPYYSNMHQDVYALITGKSSLHAVDFLKYLPFIPEMEIKGIRDKAYELFGRAIQPNTQTYSHPEPPKNMTEFLLKPYHSAANMNLFL